jgi:predicted HTH domain antitoxin
LQTLHTAFTCLGEFAKASELAGLSRFDFSRTLAQRGIARHYGDEEKNDDTAHGRSQ